MNNSHYSQSQLLAKQAMIDMALTDREQFRVQAEASLLLFDRRERKLLQKIETKTVSAYDVLYAWKNELDPIIKELQAKSVDKAFHADIKKQLLLDEGEVNQKVQQLIDQRIDEVRNRFLEQAYIKSSAKKRRLVKAFLLRTDQELNELLSHIESVTLSKIVAYDYGITLVDHHSSVSRRLTNRHMVRRERRRLRSHRNKRLTYIQQRQEELTVQNNGLLSAIDAMGWDLITVISLRNQYEKLVSSLPPTSAKNITKRLTIFEEVTQELRNNHIEKFNTKNPKFRLELAYKQAREVDALLLKIFNLSNVQKNQLLICSKEYRELTEERVTLLTEDNLAHIV